MLPKTDSCLVLYRKLAHVSVNLVQVFFWYKFLARNWAQLCWIHNRNCLACDTKRATRLAGKLFWCKKQWWTCEVFHASFLHKFLIHVYWVCVAGIRVHLFSTHRSIQCIRGPKSSFYLLIYTRKITPNQVSSAVSTEYFRIIMTTKSLNIVSKRPSTLISGFKSLHSTAC